MKKSYITALAVALALLPIMAMAHTESDPYTIDLIAGQNMDAGDVKVWNDGNYLYVTYDTDEDWCLTETHLHVATPGEEIPTTSKGNPIPGQFEYSMEHDCVDSYTYKVDLSEEGANIGDDLEIATHAVVIKTEVITEAPYYASTVIDYNQGLKKDGTAVLAARSVPEQGLVYETGQEESNFFSLGLGGNITVEFECPIRNGEGNDLKIIEDTWGTYPVEKVAVYASPDGGAWTYLGEADNTQRDPDFNIHTIAEFDLGELEEAKYIKIVDTTDPAVHNNAADGYDLNAVQSLQDCVEVTEETAWGAGTRFVDKGNWGMYFPYTVQSGGTAGDGEIPLDGAGEGDNYNVDRDGEEITYDVVRDTPGCTIKFEGATNSTGGEDNLGEDGAVETDTFKIRTDKDVSSVNVTTKAGTGEVTTTLPVGGSATDTNGFTIGLSQTDNGDGTYTYAFTVTSDNNSGTAALSNIKFDFCITPP
ncbi:MAG: hypothetical protein AB3K77_07455 [Methanosarcinaceae archaeon]